MRGDKALFLHFRQAVLDHPRMRGDKLDYT